MTAAALLALVWQPYYAPRYLLVAALLLAVLAMFVYARSWRARPLLSAAMGVMRLCLILVVTALLMGPSNMPQVQRQPKRPGVTIMLDTSASMQTSDMGDMSRIDFAVNRWLNPEQLEELGRNFDVALIGFDEAPRALTPAALGSDAAALAVGQVSNVATSVSQTLSILDNSNRSSALLLLSDGRDSHDQPMRPVALAAAERSIPIHVVALGQARMQRDVALAVVPMQETLFVNETGHLSINVMQTNAEATTTTLHLRSGETHLTRPIAFQDHSTVAVTLPIEQAEPGVYEYDLAVDPVEGEIEKRNNRQRIFVEVIAERMRVLILEAEPYWDTKFLAQSLRKDDRVALTQISQIVPKRPPQVIVSRSSKSKAKVPESAADLAAYDAIIFGRGIERILSPQVARLLPDYVSKHGGRIVFARGRAYDPSTPLGQRIGQALAVLEPVVWDTGLSRDLKLVLTPAGGLHPSFAFAQKRGNANDLISQLPALAVAPIRGREKPAAQVLATSQLDAATAQPILLSMPYGRGMVVALVGQGLWRWSMLPGELSPAQDGATQGKPIDADALKGVFDQFWSNMIRWLVLGSDFQPGRPISLRLSQRSLPLGERLGISLAGRYQADGDRNVQLTVMDPQGKTYHPAQESAGQVGGSILRQQAWFQPRIPGEHRVVVTAPILDGQPLEAKFSVYDVDAERLFSATNRQALRRLALESGGLMLNPAEPEKLAESLLRYQASTLVPPRPRHVWDQWWILTLILIWAGSEWLIRRTGGLL
jgi:hypothetical protein